MISILPSDAHPYPLPNDKAVNSMRYQQSVIIVLVLLIGGLLSPLTPARAEEGWPRTLTQAEGALTLSRRPERIVSTSPSLTGILLGIGVPVAASAATTPSVLTDDKGFFSQWASVADARGTRVLYPALRFDIEAVIRWKPDLVIVSATGADSAKQHYAALTGLGIPTLVVDYSSRSWEDIAVELGRATGHEEGAAKAIKDLDDYARSQAARITVPAGPVSIVGYNIGGSYSVGRPQSPQAKLLEMLGFKVAGLPESLRPQVTRSSDFDFISHENLPAAIAGESVFLLRGSEGDVKSFLADPVLANRPAVMNHRVFALGPSSFRIDCYSGRQMIDTVVSAFAKQ
jgi:iron complex transport system substrate-binding protein